MANNLWTKEQSIVTLRTYFSIPFNKASNTNKEIIETARIIGRSINAVKMKIGNFGSLDPELAKRGIVGLSGTSNLDKEVWHEYANNLEKLSEDSALLISKFSKKSLSEIIGFNENEIPDGIEKERMVKVRINQQFFRNNILGIYDNCCCVTGLNTPSLLVASHIVPWAVDKNNRLNPSNGLCLNALHDKAFDSGNMTITTDFKIKFSDNLKQNGIENSALNSLLQFEGNRINLPERCYPDKDFLDYHFKNIFLQ
jgi:putative restriction endonuclease